MRRYPQFRSTPNLVTALPSQGVVSETLTVRSRRGLGLQARFNATHTPEVAPLLAGRAVVSTTFQPAWGVRVNHLVSGGGAL